MELPRGGPELRGGGQSTKPRAGVQATEHHVTQPGSLVVSSGTSGVEGGDRAACDSKTISISFHL